MLRKEEAVISPHLELQRLKRLKETLAVRPDRSSRMLAQEDWNAELEDRIAALEKGLHLTERQAA